MEGFVKLLNELLWLIVLAVIEGLKLCVDAIVFASGQINRIFNFITGERHDPS